MILASPCILVLFFFFFDVGALLVQAVKKARAYFNCSSVSAVMMEDMYGGSTVW